ncbi:MAG TPA: pitrilysin family protein [Chloroflexia bacterium]|nr:pitrilysin family protein [Chloroflexia bacterium]
MRPTTALSPASVTRQLLPNGIVVLVYPNPAIPAITVRLRTRGGGLYDPPGKAGVAGLTAAAMRRGTHAHSFTELNEITDARGLSLNVDSGTSTLSVAGRGLREDTAFLFDTMAEVLRAPAFPADEIERLRSQWITGLLQQEDDTQSKADEIFRTAIYAPTHPYSRDPGGTLESVRSITRADLEAHYAHYVRPEGAILVVVGDIAPAAALDHASRVFGDWQVAGPVPPFAIPDAPLPDGIRAVHHPLAGKTQNDLVLGFPAIRRSDPAYYACEMMNLILGRLGLYGRLGKSVREDQGLAYYAYSGFEAGLGPGPWAVRAGVNPANVSRAVASILAEMRRIQDTPISPQELAAGQRYLTGTLPLRLETNSGLAGQILEIEIFDLGWDYVQRYSALVNSLTIADVQHAARMYLHPDRYVLATAGPDIPPDAPG